MQKVAAWARLPKNGNENLMFLLDKQVYLIKLVNSLGYIYLLPWTDLNNNTGL